jgi:hypothetical protein
LGTASCCPGQITSQEIIEGSPFQIPMPVGTIVSIVVTAFAGTPGSPPCHDLSTSALAHKYGSMPQAAVALGYSSVKALQSDITLFCGS